MNLFFFPLRRPLLTLVAAGATLTVAANAAYSIGPEYFPVQAGAGMPLPFSEAVKLGDTLYVSGQIGTRPGSREVEPGGIAPEARRALGNIQAILERHGSSLDQVVKCTVFLADIKDWPAFNEIYREYFKTNLPARSALGTSGLALGAKVEIECIAYVPPLQAPQPKAK